MESGGKKGSDLKEIDLNFLNQLAVTLEQAEIKLEEAFKRKKPEQFNAVRQFMIKMN